MIRFKNSNKHIGLVDHPFFLFFSVIDEHFRPNALTTYSLHLSSSFATSTFLNPSNLKSSCALSQLRVSCSLSFPVFILKQQQNLPIIFIKTIFHFTYIETSYTSYNIYNNYQKTN